MFNQIDERKSLKFRRENVLTENLIKRLELFGTLDVGFIDLKIELK